MPTRSVSPEVIECPLCCGAGELTRAEILDRLGVKDFARVAQLSAEEAFRLLQQKHSSDHQQAWARFESQLMMRTAELRERFKDELRLASSEKESLSRRVEDSLREIAQLHEKNQLLEGEMAKAARIGAREEMDFAEEAKTWAGVWISDKLPRNGDFILAYRATNGDPVEPKILIDCKDKSAVAESDIEKLVRDAKERSIRVHYPDPFRFERLPAHGFTCPTVPVRCVALIALFAMEVCVNPRSLHSFVLLRGFVRSRPITLAIPPQSGECVRETRWRFGRGEGLAKFVKRHFCISLDERPAGAI